MERYTLVPFQVSSRDLQLVGSAVTYTKQQSSRNVDSSHNFQILTAIETRIPTAQFRGCLEISSREAELLLTALNTYCEPFRSRTKHQSLFQELQHLAARLADTMEGRKTRNHGRGPLLFIKPKDAHFGE
jgi:hypothetical protein